jgi:hypothetical protein
LAAAFFPRDVTLPLFLRAAFQTTTLDESHIRLRVSFSSVHHTTFLSEGTKQSHIMGAPTYQPTHYYLPTYLLQLTN